MSVLPATATFMGRFDVQVDSNHRWDSDRILEVDVYTISIDAGGEVSTDSLNPVVSVSIPAGDFCEDRWIDSIEQEEIKTLPKHARAAYDAAVMLAKVLQIQEHGDKVTPYVPGATVFITEHRFPGDVIALTTDGRYVVEMANSGELAVFTDDELETYDAERWHNG